MSWPWSVHAGVRGEHGGGQHGAGQQQVWIVADHPPVGLVPAAPPGVDLSGGRVRAELGGGEVPQAVAAPDGDGGVIRIRTAGAGAGASTPMACAGDAATVQEASGTG